MYEREYKYISGGEIRSIRSPHRQFNVTTSPLRPSIVLPTITKVPYTTSTAFISTHNKHTSSSQTYVHKSWAFKYRPLYPEAERLLNINDIIEAFDIKPKDYEAAWNSLKARITEANTTDRVPTLATSSLTSLKEALKLFHLREVNTTLFGDIQLLPIPRYLEENIARIYSVTNGGCDNDAFSRIILDQILISSLYEEGHGLDQQAKEAKEEKSKIFSYGHGHSSTSEADNEEEPAKLELLREAPISRLVTHQGEKRLLTGFADCSVWYNGENKKLLATNFVIIEAKREFYTDAALPQLAAYMGVIHATRKENSENSVVYGVCSDGRNFRFCCIDNDSVFVMSDPIAWRSNKDKIYSIMRFLLRAAALPSPSTTLIKDPMRRRIVLTSFGSPHPNKIDFASKFEFFYEDELNDEEYEIMEFKFGKT